ncbi:uncharacterized protein TNCT_615951 [Trichonephila clavata]|uniref:Gustatory receptor n=1 Tax=Trichonephila clavata TaxID=2740835 RepID=A0A8X6KK33_TRICU|nr:uncharacterized protein TNCT_615951 [Trichonephila clavata]
MDKLFPRIKSLKQIFLFNGTATKSDSSNFYPQLRKRLQLRFYSRTSDSPLPHILLGFLYCTGFVDRHLISKTKSAASVFFIISLHFTILDLLFTSVENHDDEFLKVSIAYISSYGLTVAVWYSTWWKRKQIGNLLLKIKRISSPLSGKVINYLALINFSMSLIIPVVLGMNNRKIQNSYFYTYGYDIDNFWAKTAIVSTRIFISFSIYPTYTSTLALFYVYVCLCCITYLKSLSKRMAECPCKSFDLSFQRDILKKKAKIFDLLLRIQDIFSLPAFFIIVANIMICSSIAGWHMMKSWSDSDYLWKIESIYFGINAFLCTVSIICVAGSVPIELDRFKETFHQKSHQRLIFFCNWEELLLKLDLFNEPNLVLSGWQVISFRKSTILTLIGTLLTYTLFIMNINK